MTMLSMRSMMAPRSRQRGFIINPFAAQGGGTPPATDPYFSSVVQLAHFQGSNGSTTITNSCSRGTTLLVRGSAALSNAQAKWGATSLRVIGSTSSAGESAGHADYGFGTGDFTIEMWARFDSVSGVVNVLGLADGSNYAIYFISGQPYYYALGNAIVGSAGALVINTWQFISYSRVSGVGYMGVDGVSQGSWSDVLNYTIIGTLLFFGSTGSGTGFTGYVGEVRVTKGVGRYDGTTYAVPTAAFPNS